MSQVIATKSPPEHLILHSSVQVNSVTRCLPVTGRSGTELLILIKALLPAQHEAYAKVPFSSRAIQESRDHFWIGCYEEGQGKTIW